MRKNRLQVIDEKTEPLYDIGTLVEKTGLTRGFIRKAMSVYGLPHYKIGKMIKFRMSDIEVWLEQRKVVG